MAAIGDPPIYNPYDHFECVISGLPLKRPVVSLVPCMHKATAAAATAKFGEMSFICPDPKQRDGHRYSGFEEGTVTKQGRPCPRCFETVRAYYPDQQFEEVIESRIPLAPERPQGAQIERSSATLLPKTKFLWDSGKENALWTEFVDSVKKKGEGVLLEFKCLNDDGLFDAVTFCFPNEKDPWMTIMGSNKNPATRHLLPGLLMQLKAVQFVNGSRYFPNLRINRGMFESLKDVMEIPEPQLSFMETLFPPNE